MIELQKKNRFSCKVWVNERVDCAPLAEFSCGATIAAKGNDSLDGVESIAVEYRGCANVNYYGLLGFRYQADTSGRDGLTVTVKYVKDKPLDMEQYKGYVPESVTDGIGEFYAQAILNEAKIQFEARDFIPSGQLVFCYGKTSDCGSSIQRFRFLVKLLIDLYYANGAIPDENQLNLLIDNANTYINNNRP